MEGYKEKNEKVPFLVYKGSNHRVLSIAFQNWLYKYTHIPLVLLYTNGIITHTVLDFASTLENFPYQCL